MEVQLIWFHHKTEDKEKSSSQDHFPQNHPSPAKYKIIDQGFGYFHSKKAKGFQSKHLMHNKFDNYYIFVPVGAKTYTITYCMQPQNLITLRNLY